MREIEWKLLSELMKNSRRSDRELAKAIGSSQPTVSRHRKKLEEEGHIREYTMIPKFEKLGYDLLCLSFLKLQTELSPEKVENARKIAVEALADGPSEVVMLERGRGMGYQGVVISFHRDYDSYMKFLGWLRQFEFIQIFEIGSFVVSLKDRVRYRPLTFETLAGHLLELRKKEK